MSASTWERAPDERVAWITSTPYVLAHVAVVVGAFVWTPTWELMLVMVGSYYLRMFGITAGYHRYFAHRGFKTGRVFQFVLAMLGSVTSQKGVLWWAGHHRHHHKVSDMPEDIHSPKRGFWWSHQGWFMCRKYDETPMHRVKDFAKFPELVFLNRTWLFWPFAYTAVMYLLGGAAWAFWGGLVSTVVLWHGTFTINSLAHVWGSVRYPTTDTSKNNFWLALLTMGEGWHNNHHFYQSTARNGFFWWEVDASYYILKVLSWFGIVWDLRQPPAWVLEGRSSKFPDAQPSLPQAQVVVPSALEEAVAALAALRAGAAEDKTFARLGERGADAAERAAEFAQKASADARASASALQAKVALVATEAAEKGAALAKEAAEAASEAASRLETRAAEKWAETAKAAAKKAAEAAAQARAAYAALQPA